MTDRPRIEAGTLNELTRDLERLQALGVPRDSIPEIAKFDKIAARHAKIGREASEHIPGLTAKRDETTRAYATGKATLDDVRAATGAVNNTDPVQLHYQTEAAQRELSAEALDLLTGHEAEWIAALWPAIDAHFDVIRELNRPTVEGAKRWIASTHGVKVKLSEHYQLHLSHAPNPLEARLDVTAAWSSIRNIYGTAARLRYRRVMPGAGINLPRAVWQWRAADSELGGVVFTYESEPTLEGAIVLMDRGIAPSLNTLEEVEALNNLNNPNQLNNESEN